MITGKSKTTQAILEKCIQISDFWEWVASSQSHGAFF